MRRRNGPQRPTRVSTVPREEEPGVVLVTINRKTEGSFLTECARAGEARVFAVEKVGTPESRYHVGLVCGDSRASSCPCKAVLHGNDIRGTSCKHVAAMSSLKHQ